MPGAQIQSWLASHDVSPAALAPAPAPGPAPASADPHGWLRDAA